MKNIVLISILLFSFLGLSAQNAQDDYLKSDKKKHGFSQKKWKKLRKRVIKESRGNKGNPGDYNLKPQDVTTEDYSDESFYEYQEESNHGEYSDYEYDTDPYYEDQGSGSGGGSGGGNGYGSGSGDGGGSGNGGNGGSYNDEYYYDDNQDVDKGQYKSHPEDYEYDEKKTSSSSSSGDGGGGGFLMVLLIIVLAAVLAFIIYQLFMKTELDEKGAKVVKELEELAPTEIPKTELELMLEKALADKDYRLAVRIYFIFIIKDLSEKGWIRWQKKKTNIAYLMEMRGRTQYNMFSDAVSIFEIVWYGNYGISQSDYQALEPKLKALLNDLNSGK